MAHCIDCRIKKNTNRPRCNSCAAKDRAKARPVWNKGLKGVQVSWNKGLTTPPETRSKQSKAAKEKYANGFIHPQFKGDEVGYVALHGWIKRRLARPLGCNWCGEIGQVHLSNKSHEYKRELNDWLWLCVTCHKKHDKGRSDTRKHFVVDENNRITKRRVNF